MSVKMIDNSNEQNSILSNISTFNISINAVAGSGKTTTSLLISKHYTNLNILLLTFNSRLKKETRNKIEEQQLKNIDMHSFHSFGYSFYSKESINDSGLNKILQLNLDPINMKKKYDIIIIDEAQDLTSLFFKFIHKIIKDFSNEDYKLCMIGDIKQNIYKFKGSDVEYIMNPEKFFTNKFEWKKLTLSISFRVPNTVTNLVNDLLQIPNYINPYKLTNDKPILIVEKNMFNPKITLELILSEIKQNKIEDIIILAPSIKGQKTPLRRLSEELLNKNIPLFIPISDDELIDTDILDNKLTFCTFHQSKGIERKIVFLFNFDESYNIYYNKTCKKFPNELYVAMTRCSSKLYLIQNSENNIIKFTNKESLLNFCSIKGDVMSLKNTTNDKSHKFFKNDYTVIDLCNYINSELLEYLFSLVSMKTLTPKSYKINLPNKIIQESGLVESVQEINAEIILLYYNYKKRGYISKLDIKNKQYSYTQVYLNIDEDLIEVLTEIAISNCAISSGYHHKKNQITNFKWLSLDILEQTYNRIDLALEGCDKYQTECALLINTNLLGFDFNISGRCDMITYHTVDNKHYNILWEFKACSEEKIEHILQLCLYNYLFNNKLDIHSYRLINILTNKVIEINIDHQISQKILETLLLYKRTKNIYNLYEGLNNNICILDCETDSGSGNLVQLSWIIANLSLNIITKKNFYILDNGIARQDFFKKISIDTINNYGVPSNVVLENLKYDLKHCYFICGHNIDFDIRMITKYEALTNINTNVSNLIKLDTMKISKPYTNFKTPTGKPKFPKLSELYEFLYCKVEDDFHDAEFDTFITYMCLKKIKELDWNMYPK